MTTLELRALARTVDIKMKHEPYILAAMHKGGAAVYGDFHDDAQQLTLVLSIIDASIKQLKKANKPRAAKMFSDYILEYLNSEYDVELPPEQLSGKDLKKRGRKTDETIKAIEAIL